MLATRTACSASVHYQTCQSFCVCEGVQVVGATGAIGQYAIFDLLERGYKVIIVMKQSITLTCMLFIYKIH